MALLAEAKSHSAAKAVLTSAAVLATFALANHLIARRTERQHPPKGAFVVVDGIRLQYSDRGEGDPIVLIHGNVVMGDDWAGRFDEFGDICEVVYLPRTPAISTTASVM